MEKPKMNYSKINNMRVLADESYGEVKTCKMCHTAANLDGGLCEACFMAVN